LFCAISSPEAVSISSLLLLFIDNPENKPTVNHINIKRDDNRVINLEWATYSEQSYKENRNKYTTTGKSVNQYDLNGNFIKTWNKAIDAENELKIILYHNNHFFLKFHKYNWYP
jgi:hypothetical protein